MRQVAVDTDGLLLGILVHAANIQDVYRTRLSGSSAGSVEGGRRAGPSLGWH